MAFWGNLEGTLKELFSLGKGTSKVEIRSNAGILEGKNYGGNWHPLVKSVEAKTANFNASFGKIYVTTNAIDVQLPAPVSGGIIRIKKTDASTVNLLRNAAEKIETVASNYALTSTRESVTLISDGTDWFII